MFVGEGLRVACSSIKALTSYCFLQSGITCTLSELSYSRLGPPVVRLQEQIYGLYSGYGYWHRGKLPRGP